MKQTENGWGVFTNLAINRGDLIEKAIMYRIKNVDGNENPHLFTWSDDRSVWAGGTGLTPFYNHSENPNISKKGYLDKDVLEIYALRNIKAGEELVGKYYSKQWRKCFQDF
tara:strand:- start:968 stop:1300 length:333 start_codon:yes stop_codon:yes gene_type:complete